MDPFERNVRPRWTPPMRAMPLRRASNQQSYALVSVYITEVVRAWCNRVADPVFLSFAVPTPFEALRPTIDDIEWDIARLLTEEHGTYTSLENVSRCLTLVDPKYHTQFH